MSEEDVVSEEEAKEISETTANVTEIELVQGTDCFQDFLKVAVGQDQDQGQVQIETELDASDAENMIILPRIVQT